MDYESTQYECDIWQGVAVITDKVTGKCGNLSIKLNGRIATAYMIKQDVAKYGPEKALRTYAKLAGVRV